MDPGAARRRPSGPARSGAGGSHVDAVVDPVVDEALDEVLALPAAALLVRSRTTETAIVDLPPGPGWRGGRAVRKVRIYPTVRDRLRGLFRTTGLARSPARREFDALVRLGALPGGGFAPRPIEVLEARRRGLLRACVLLLEEVPGAVDLGEWLASEAGPEPRRAVLRDLAARVRAMHAAGLEDRDLHPRNVLVARGPLRTFKVDCAGQRVHRGPVPLRRAAADLAALDVGLRRLARPEERQAFLGEYLGPSGTPGGLAALEAAIGRGRRRIEAREARRLPAGYRVAAPAAEG